MIKFTNSIFSSVIAEDFTKQNVQKIAQALANIIKKSKSDKSVVIGHDSKFLSPTAMNWFVETLTFNGIKTLTYPQAITSPIVQYSLETKDLEYGVIITANNNSSKYNGIKILENTKTSQISLIEKLANKNIKIINKANKKHKGITFNTELSNQKDYIKNILKYIDKDNKENKLRVLFNSPNQDIDQYLQILTKALKLKKSDIINCADNIDNFAKKTVKGRYNIGIHISQDGSTIIVIDEKGTIYNYNTILPIIYYYLHKYKEMTGDIVISRTTSVIMHSLATYTQSVCYETSQKSDNLQQKLKETNSLIAGDSNNGFYLRDYLSTPDAFLTATLLLDAMHKTGKSISRIMQDIRNCTGYISTIYTKNYTIDNATIFTKQLSKKSPNFSYKPTNIITEDNIVKYEFEDKSSILLTFLNNTTFTLTLEFPTEIECERNIKVMDNYLTTINKSKKK